MKNKKIIVAIIIIILIIAITGVSIFTINKKNEEKAKQTLTEFIQLINDKNYEAMYRKVISMNMSQEDFIKRNKNIYEGIDSSDIKIEIQKVEKQEKNYQIDYHEKMYTAAGEVSFNNTVTIEKENEEYKIKWSSSFIFPQLGNNQKIRISTIKAKRGDILDRNDVKLATDGTILAAGIVPGKLSEPKEESIQKIAELTGVSEEYINQQLEASWVKDDTFVPIKKIAESNIQLKESLLQIPGIRINQEAGRVYSLGKEAGHIMGYVQAINAEELEANEGKGYNTASKIGKSGLEKAYEETLRGIDGTEIYIIDEKENRIGEIIKQDKKDGQNVKITLDSSLQTKIYEQMKNDKGFFVVMHPKTGELLALVSTPTFDSNDFVVGMTNKQWESLNNDISKPLYNRFIQKYCPGSTFKPVTGAIGLTTGKIKKDEDYGYTTTSWQKDNSWGNYKITTLTAYNGAKNLLNAMIHSDNIYFAQSALKIGAEPLAENLNKIGFNETLEFPLNLAKSQYANQNGNQIEGETKLADTGYGQGSVLVNPIHMASIYSAFANEGNMLKPYLEYADGKTEILKQSAFTAEAANAIKESLIQVVENKEGTANDMKIDGITVAGKTGTAELKTSSEDKESGTLGWFDCFTDDLLIISMVENQQNNQDGGSHYLIKKIRNLL
ncbi:MAG: penicillin-binding transpeptidase domain-containing protein [Clostridia bacterium]|nr:penicillin-binding transpeptidase domain-containing protein [Clostridia bacterium]